MNHLNLGFGMLPACPEGQPGSECDEERPIWREGQILDDSCEKMEVVGDLRVLQQFANPLEVTQSTFPLQEDHECTHKGLQLGQGRS